MDRNARSYDPELRTWVTADEYDAPVDDLDLAMDPLSVGRLGYASGDPVNLTDDDGHFSDFCQGVCVKANGQSYQSHGYASPGGVRVNTINGNKYDNQYQGFYATGCNTACHARAAAAEAATKARWEAAQALRRKKVYAQRRAHYQKSCSENPQKSHCAKYRKEHGIPTAGAAHGLQVTICPLGGTLGLGLWGGGVSACVIIGGGSNSNHVGNWIKHPDIGLAVQHHHQFGPQALAAWGTSVSVTGNAGSAADAGGRYYGPVAGGGWDTGAAIQVSESHNGCGHVTSSLGGWIRPTFGAQAAYAGGNTHVIWSSRPACHR